MDRRKEEVNLAALLDGELRDSLLVETMNRELEGDAQLRAELEEQRAVKSALAELAEYKAPDFLATRVLGEIAARRAKQAQPRWRAATAWLGGAAALLMGFGSSVAMMWPTLSQRGAAFVASESAVPSGDVYRVASDGLAAPAVNFDDMQYAPQSWDEVQMPAGSSDDRLHEFLKFASEAHAYRKLVRSGGAPASNLTEAVMAMDSNRETPLHLISDH